ncbi:dTDP-glucose 4,6-dehydratase [Candidatus Marinamargulisbacteria bacterium SCGC AAA071-K20]|nr:dTDP-glucose 4,6-dehydratase [Candidatus Marinamargulisbacteria bacterium SCGC AAA071-K20]
MKSLLVTGGAGFIGSNFIDYFLKKHGNDYHIINLDCLTYAGNLDNIETDPNSPNHTFIEGDITDKPFINQLFETHKFHGVFHFAAESHVDNSISGPEVFIDTNIKGTFNLIEAARKTWFDAPFKIKPEFENARFHHVSTDEVYGSLGDEGFFLETTPYAPNSPYSASKASSDFIVRSYNKTFGLDITISNCSNNFGPKQHGEKLIPTIIRNALSQNPIPIYGDGQNIRDWLFVTDHCEAIDQIFHKGKTGHTYNIGTRNEKNNLELTKAICDILDEVKPSSNLESYYKLVTFVTDRPGHDQRYAIDPSKIETELNWASKEDFKHQLKQTILFYIQQYS